MAGKSRLLASSNSLAGIQKLVNDFWYSDRYSVNPETLAIEHPEYEAPTQARVIRKGGRYRFEMLEG